MFVNSEAIHEGWMLAMASICQKYLRKQYGNGICEADIMGFKELPDEALLETDDFLESKGKLELPKGANILAMYMARFCKTTDEDLSDYSFCLPSLLTASFPRDVTTGILKGYDGADAVVFLDKEIEPEIMPYVAFAGLGVILMDGTRQILAPMATDRETVLAAKDMLVVFRDK